MRNRERSESVALITGASRGLGLEVARLYAGRGMPLIITARHSLALAVAADELSRLTEVLALPGDVGRFGPRRTPGPGRAREVRANRRSSE